MISLVAPGTPREQVQARFPDGRLLEAPPGTPLSAFVAAAARPSDPLAIAALVDGRLRELSDPLERDADLASVFVTHPDGALIYRRALVLLLVTAAAEEFPEAEVWVQHAATSAAAYYCEVRGRAPFDAAELGRIERRMRELVEADEPILKRRVTRDQAIELFRSRGEQEKARRFSYRDGEDVTLYGLRGRWDSLLGYMPPSTGYLRHFALQAFPPGLMLYFLHRERPVLEPVTPYPKLFAVFAEAASWLEKLEIRSVGELDDALAEGRLSEVSLVAEALHSARIAEIAQSLAGDDRHRIVLVAGPSASGKTTFAKRLAVQLLARGIRPFPLSLDDYFLPREKTPCGPDGKPDFEALEALDLPLLSEQLATLIGGRRVVLPRYDFRTGQRETGTSVELAPGQVLIIEGIHGLNPRLVEALPADSLFRVYVSALTQLNLDRHNRVSTSDGRLLRRLVRDATSRGYSARSTLERWHEVTRAEKENIFRFQEHADFIFNSALPHELAVLRPFAEPLLRQVRPETPQFVEAKRLLAFLRWFEPAGAQLVPGHSILREFIGGSILENLRPWPAGRRGAPAPA